MTRRFPRAVAATVATALCAMLPFATVPAQAAPTMPAVTVSAPTVVLPMSTSRDAHTKKGAAAAFKRWFKQWNADDWEAQYDRLVFEQQELFTLDQFVAWRSDDYYPTVKWVKTVSVKKTRTTIPGTDVRLKTYRVRARVKLYGVKINVSSHWFYQDSRWRWSLSENGLDELLAFSTDE